MWGYNECQLYENKAHIINGPGLVFFCGHNLCMNGARIYKLNRNQDQCAFSDFLKLSNNLSVLDGFMLIFIPFFPLHFANGTIRNKHVSCVHCMSRHYGLMHCGRTRLFGDMLTWKAIIWRFYFILPFHSTIASIIFLFDISTFNSTRKCSIVRL